MSRFQNFHKKHGPPSESEAVSQKSMDFYAGKLPAEVLEEWQHSGWCAYGDGLLWTVDPAAYVEVLDEWLGASAGLYAFLRTAFGDIYYWDGTGVTHLDVQDGDTTPVPRRMDILFDGLFCDKDYLENVLQYKMFKQALAKLGRLQRDECYAFSPPIAMGGSGKLETVRRYKLREQLSILAGLNSKERVK